MTLEDLLEAARSRIRRYTPDEASAAAERGALIVDLRARDARERDGVIPGAHHVPRSVLEWRVLSAEASWRNRSLEGGRLILVCDHGYSSSLAAATLVDLGCDAGDVIGGFAAWRDAGLPVGRARPAEGVPGLGPPD
jgi:rhodanese-related sulfurtransferase